MDYITRQFINLAKHFRKDLRKALTDLQSALHKQTEAIRKSYQASDTQQSTPPEITVHTHFPESIQVAHNARDTRDEQNYKRATFFVAALTLGAIVVYADLVYWQYREMVNATGAAQQAVNEARLNRLQADKSFKATVEQFQLDQRAWVGLKGFECKDCKVGIDGVTFNIGKLTVTLVNTGKTPALDMAIEATWAIRKNSDPIPNFEATAEDRRKVWDSLGGIPKDISPKLLKKWTIRPRLVLPPNGTYEYLIVTGLRPPRSFLPKTKVEDILMTYGIGKITYTDPMTKKTHTTRFCIFNNGGTADFYYCSEGNSMD